MSLIPVTAIYRATLNIESIVFDIRVQTLLTRTLLSGSLNCLAMFCAMARRYLGLTHWIVDRADW